MLDRIWNLFQDEDIDRLRAERRRQESQSDGLQKYPADGGECF